MIDLIEHGSERINVLFRIFYKPLFTFLSSAGIHDRDVQRIFFSTSGNQNIN